MKKLLEDLIGTRGAYLLDSSLNILGKVPLTELAPSINTLGSVFAVILDGRIDYEMIQAAERANVHYLVGMNTNASTNGSRVEVLTTRDLA